MMDEIPPTMVREPNLSALETCFASHPPCLRACLGAMINMIQNMFGIEVCRYLRVSKRASGWTISMLFSRCKQIGYGLRYWKAIKDAFMKTIRIRQFTQRVLAAGRLSLSRSIVQLNFGVAF